MHMTFFNYASVFCQIIANQQMMQLILDHVWNFNQLRGFSWNVVNAIIVEIKRWGTIFLFLQTPIETSGNKNRKFETLTVTT